MTTYLIRTVKTLPTPKDAGKVDENIGVSGNPQRYVQSIQYNELSGTTEMLKSHNVNDYLIDIENDRIESLRYIINSIVRAETYVLQEAIFRYVLVYQVELGQKITTETKMFLLFNLTPQPRSYNGGVYPGTNSVRKPRQTWRGSGRYEPVKVNDPPYYFYQEPLYYVAKNPAKLPVCDRFLGLNVVFGRLRGDALKHVYMGTGDETNWILDDRGNIVFHRKGSIYKGAIQGYRKQMALIAHFFSNKQFDKDGVLIETGKVIENCIPTLITDFRAQRRAAYTNGAATAMFKRRVIERLNHFFVNWCQLYADVSAHCHNVNYDVEGYRQTKKLYLLAEYIVRMISDHFPEQLVFDQSRASKEYTLSRVPQSEKLQLGDRSEQAVECYDAMLRYVEWMRQNYVDYTSMDEKDLKDEDCSKKFLRINDDFKDVTYIRKDFNVSTAQGETMRVDDEIINTFKRVDEHTFEQTTTNWHHYVHRGRPAGRYTSKTLVKTHEPSRKFGTGWSDDNRWLERTRGTAADIEQSHLTFQANSRQFLHLLAHFETCCFPVPLEKGKRKAGKLAGQTEPTKQMLDNRKRIYIKSDGEKLPDEPDGDLKKAPAKLEPLPNFCPLQVDSRQVIRRCQKDEVAAEDYDPDVEEMEKNELEKEDERKKQEKEERERKPDKPKREHKWRNEIDPIDAQQLDYEEGKMWEKIVDNELLVAEGIGYTLDAISLFGTGGAAAPAVVAKNVYLTPVKAAGKQWLKKVAKKLAEEYVTNKIEDQIDQRTNQEDYEPDASDDYHTHEHDPNTDPDTREPLEHKYEPPKKDKTPEDTGDEDFPFDDCLQIKMGEKWIESNVEYAAENAMGFRKRHSFLYPDNGVDSLVIEALERPLGRKLRQKNVSRYVDALGPDGLLYPTEVNPKSRFRCKRVKHRLPRP